MSIQTTLGELGLNPKEIKVYLALLKTGRTTPAALAKETNINRPTVYNIVSSLHGKGIIAQDLTDKTLFVSALPPENLGKMFERSQRELDEKKKTVKKAVEELSLITAEKTYSVPKIQFVQEHDLNNFLYENIQRWQESVREHDSMWWVLQDPSFLEQYKEWNEWYWNQPFSKGVRLNQITNDAVIEQEFYAKIPAISRDTRLATDVKFTSSIWVGGDYLIMIVTQQHPHYLVEIHDKTLAHNMREVFKKLLSQETKI